MTERCHLCIGKITHITGPKSTEIQQLKTHCLTPSRGNAVHQMGGLFNHPSHQNVTPVVRKPMVTPDLTPTHKGV